MLSNELKVLVIDVMRTTAECVQHHMPRLKQDVVELLLMMEKAVLEEETFEVYKKLDILKSILSVDKSQEAYEEIYFDYTAQDLLLLEDLELSDSEDESYVDRSKHDKNVMQPQISVVDLTGDEESSNSIIDLTQDTQSSDSSQEFFGFTNQDLSSFKVSNFESDANYDERDTSTISSVTESVRSDMNLTKHVTESSCILACSKKFSSSVSQLPISNMNVSETGQDSYLQVENMSILDEKPNFVGLDNMISNSSSNNLTFKNIGNKNENGKKRQSSQTEKLSARQKRKISDECKATKLKRTCVFKAKDKEKQKEKHFIDLKPLKMTLRSGHVVGTKVIKNIEIRNQKNITNKRCSNKSSKTSCVSSKAKKVKSGYDLRPRSHNTLKEPEVNSNNLNIIKNHLLVNKFEEKSNIKSSDINDNKNLAVNPDYTLSAEMESNNLFLNENDEISFLLPENLSQEDQLKVAECFAKANSKITMEISDVEFQQLLDESPLYNNSHTAEPEEVIIPEDLKIVSNDDIKRPTILYEDHIPTCFSLLQPPLDNLTEPLDEESEQKQIKMAQKLLKPSAMPMELILQKANEIIPEILSGCTIKKLVSCGSYSETKQNLLINWILDVSLNVTKITKYEEYLKLLANCLKFRIFYPDAKPLVKELTALCKFYILLNIKIGNERAIYTLLLNTLTFLTEQAPAIILEIMKYYPRLLQHSNNLTDNPLEVGIVHVIFNMKSATSGIQLRCLQNKLSLSYGYRDLKFITRNDVAQMMLSLLMDGRINAACGLAILSVHQEYEWYKTNILFYFEVILKTWTDVDVLIVAEIIHAIAFIGAVFHRNVGIMAVTDASETLQVINCMEIDSLTIKLALHDSFFCLAQYDSHLTKHLWNTMST